MIKIFFIILFNLGVFLVIICFCLVWVSRILDAIYCGYLEVFVHRGLTVEDFLLKYQKNLQEMSWGEELKIYVDEFVFYFYTDLTPFKLYCFCLCLLYVLLCRFAWKFYDTSFKAFFEEKKKEFLGINHLPEQLPKEEISYDKIRNKCLYVNLLENFKIRNDFYKKEMSTERSANDDYNEQTKTKIFINLVELHAILKENSLSLDHLIIIKEYLLQIDLKLQGNNELPIHAHAALLSTRKHCFKLFVIMENNIINKVPFDMNLRAFLFLMLSTF